MRIPPQDLEAEAALLGAMLLSKDAACVGIEKCSAGDFYRPAYGHIFHAIVSLRDRGEPVDAVTVTDELKRSGLLEAVGDPSFFISLVANTPSIAHAGHYARIVAGGATRRRLIAAAGEIAEIGYSPGTDPAEMMELAQLLLEEAGAERVRRRLSLVTIADVETEPVHWLWPGRLARGKVTVADGDPGLGKSTVALDLAARLSTASPMPDGHRPEAPADVILASAEDGIADTIRPRLEAAGAALARVHAVDLAGPDVVVLPDGVPALEAEVARHHAALVIVDPLVAFLATDVNSYRDQDVRRVMFALARLAERTGAAVMAIRHLTKSPGGSAIYRGGGSIGFIGAARIGLLIGADPKEERRRLLAVSKCNLAPIAPTLSFHLVPDELHDVGRIEWTGTAEMSADELVAIRTESNPEQTSAVDGACRFLEELLSVEPVWVKDVKESAKAAGLSWASVRRAKDRMRVEAIKVGKPRDADQGWQWMLLTGHEGAQETRRCP
jgi:hypothetical protein